MQPYIKAERRDAAQMIRLLDTNNDGVVSYEEFRAYLSLLPAAGLTTLVHFLSLTRASGLRVSYLRQRDNLRVVTRRYTGVGSRAQSEYL